MFSYRFFPYEFIFHTPVGTSRGRLEKKTSWFLALWDPREPHRIGWGEAGLLPGLSPENPETFEKDALRFLQHSVAFLAEKSRNWERVSIPWLENWSGPWLPSVVMALETAWLDWANGGQKLTCDSLFHAGLWSVPINGLVWMNPRETMEKDALAKQTQGFDTLKFKVGALDWEQEWDMLVRLREQLPAGQFAFRLDANGAWTEEEALRKLERLSGLNIESIEQPLAPGQNQALARVCRNSPIPIALDEELIGKPEDRDKFALLEEISPAFVVLKPSLLGGLGQTHLWIRMAEDLGIGWWITSMLESNLGLNAIAQLCAQYRPVLPQGLGTGGIYRNNLVSPLRIAEGKLSCDPLSEWDLAPLEKERIGA